MEEQHPIPQQISAYQFKLVGDMTLKQFFQVAGGALVALVIYSSSFAPYIKWPLILLSFLTGVALAFFPLEDRPLSKWIVLFLKAIYSPTLYVWRRQEKTAPIFMPEPEEARPTITPQEAKPNQQFVGLEQKEAEFLSKVGQQISDQSIIPLTIQRIPPVAREKAKLSPFDQELGSIDERVQILKIPKVQVTPGEKPETKSFQETTGASDIFPGTTQITPLTGQRLASQKAQFSLEAAPPAPPTKANIVVGQTLDPSGKIIDSAILEIRDSDGRPVRALKSNKLGHFMIVTPLTNGKYEIITEKEGFSFEPVSFEAKGDIILPIAIKAKGN